MSSPKHLASTGRRARSSRFSALVVLAVVLTPVGIARATGPDTSAPADLGLDLTGIDASIAPGDDFFAHANGAWMKTAVIPPDRAVTGPWTVLADLTDERTAELIRSAGATAAPDGSDARRIADYYESYLDEATIEARGLRPLQPQLDRIVALSDRRALARALGSSLRADVDVLNNTDLYTDNLFGLWVAQDLRDPTRYVPFLLQGGLDMPDRSYYLDVSPRMAGIRARFEEHVAAVLRLANMPDAAARAQRVAALERRIAEVHVGRVESANVGNGLNHWKRVDFGTVAPGLDWPEFFAAAGLAEQPELVVWQPGALKGISALVASEPLDTWKDYLAFHAVDRASPVLPRAFVDERFAFHGRVLFGIEQLRDRWKRAVDATNAALGDAVGRLYVERYFPASEKARAEEMVRNLIVAFGRRIDRLAWMTPETKAVAKAKLAALKVGVGYPDHWQDYSDLAIVRGEAFANRERAGTFQYRQAVRKLGRPVDRSEWVMTPQTINAVNLPAMNAMNFPAAILQPPFFDPRRPAAIDYGAIGAIIGHEVSHSFDDQGAQFDPAGRLRNWWTEADLGHFRAAAARLVTQYDAYHPFPDVAVDGKLTLGENIADVAGIAAAHDAYRLSLGDQPAPPVGGLSGDQQFFLSFAQSWRSKTREAALRQQVLTDGHSPAEYRADAVRNIDAWYDAFAVKPGQALALAPAERVRIW